MTMSACIDKQYVHHNVIIIYNILHITPRKNKLCDHAMLKADNWVTKWAFTEWTKQMFLCFIFVATKAFQYKAINTKNNCFDIIALGNFMSRYYSFYLWNYKAFCCCCSY